MSKNSIGCWLCCRPGVTDEEVEDCTECAGTGDFLVPFNELLAIYRDQRIEEVDVERYRELEFNEDN